MKFLFQRDKNTQLGLLKNLLSMHKILFASLLSTILPFPTLFYCYLSVIILLYQQPPMPDFFLCPDDVPSILPYNPRVNVLYNNSVCSIMFFWVLCTQTKCGMAYLDFILIFPFTKTSKI